jgi:uncharacterized protein with HEPN domain
MKRSISLYVSDTLQNIDDVTNYIAGMDFDEFTAPAKR